MAHACCAPRAPPSDGSPAPPAGLRVRPQQTLWVQAIVTALILLYGGIVCGILSHISHAYADEWCQRQRCAAILIASASLWCLWAASLTHPGVIPEGWNGTSSRPTDPDLAWCKPCENWKPVRTHHCSECGVCVPRFDHHCDWIDNCVGQRNHKHFALFLLYVTLCIVHYFFMLYHYNASGERTSYQPLGQAFEPPHRRRSVTGVVPPCSFPVLIFLIVYTLAAFGLLLFACSFLSCTWAQLLGNMTTYDESTNSEGADCGYSRGWLANLSEVMGTHPLVWLIPTTNALVLDEGHAASLGGTAVGSTATKRSGAPGCPEGVGVMGMPEALVSEAPGRPGSGRGGEGGRARGLGPSVEADLLGSSQLSDSWVLGLSGSSHVLSPRAMMASLLGSSGSYDKLKRD